MNRTPRQAQAMAWVQSLAVAVTPEWMRALVAVATRARVATWVCVMAKTDGSSDGLGIAHA
jgi:hypothetical protein